MGIYRVYVLPVWSRWPLHGCCLLGSCPRVRENNKSIALRYAQDCWHIRLAVAYAQSGGGATAPNVQALAAIQSPSTPTPAACSRLRERAQSVGESGGRKEASSQGIIPSAEMGLSGVDGQLYMLSSNVALKQAGVLKVYAVGPVSLSLCV